jgi:protein-S-isoprenylcysteine O-methyltransferase Ste14
MRHPLYFGEGMATAGILIFRLSKINIALTALFIIGQVVRAGIEEKKLMLSFPDYREYKQKTGAFFPRLRARE